MEHSEGTSVSGSTPRASSHEVQRINDTLDIEKGRESENTYEVQSKQPQDPNIVDWDGPDDPENPLNWSKSKKLKATVSIALITLLTPLGSSMFAPGVIELVQDFHITSTLLSSFVVSVYLLGYSIGPLLIAPLSEIYGRRIIFNVCNVIYVVFTILCAVAPEIGSLIVFRFFAGCAGSCPLTIGAGSIADMYVRERRGRAISSWAMGPILGPVVGPVAGGYLSQAKGWRWTFWVLAMASGAVTISSYFTIKESYAPTLLEKKAKKLRKETGNPNLRSVLDRGKTPRELFMFSIVRPVKMLVFSPIVIMLSTYVALVYGYLYLLFTTISEVFTEQYHWSQGSVGLAYLGIGIGSLFGLSVLSATSDSLLKFLTRKHGGEPKPEYRLPPMIPGALLVPSGLFIYGWTAYYRTHWIVPIIGTSLLGLGMLLSFMTVSTYLVDAYTIYAASAVAANTVLRSLVGALLPLAGPRLAFSPLPIIFYLYGERIRKSRLAQVEF
ncbi:MFS transporter cpaT [Penicillium chermesinum]|uniref:MFS transporter cpaT n=1 Tax=Penicillium chermesinum TaxID=63820 RepID=A0A9W9PHW7_9EURO|nr:MFS transporter cpaT [Penicillium chermesinum]KAJ5247128.1 MFS transporter cpaT [Penicillium chermesinum]KAJ6145374.1 MFS transporter cpaT [Penicillium chermesinum]